MAIEQAKLAFRIGYGGFRYVLDLKGPHGERDIKEFKSPVPQEFISQALDKFAIAFGAKQYPVKQASQYAAGGVAGGAKVEGNGRFENPVAAV